MSGKVFTRVAKPASATPTRQSEPVVPQRHAARAPLTPHVVPQHYHLNPNGGAAFDISTIPLFPPGRAGIEAKLRVGEPNDRYEREADRVADRVIGMSDPMLQRQPENEEEKDVVEGTLKRKPANHRPDKYTFHRKMHSGEASLPSNLEKRVKSLHGRGQPIELSTRTFMETRFGHTFDQVRIHSDSDTARLARSVNARAFTLGHNVAFGAGQYKPDTTSGKWLLAHELTHVVQQKKTSPITHVKSETVQKSRNGNLQRQTEEAPTAQETPTYEIVHGANFHQTLEGVELNAALLANVTSLSEHLIENNLVTANIVFTQGVRSPAVAHRWSTAWSIRNDLVPLANLLALGNGRDVDGNLWYTEGWTMEQAKQNAIGIWNGAQAAEGYTADDPRKLPNTYPNVSNHCTGNAIDISIPWANGNGTDETANALVEQFNLRRPVPGEPWHFEL